MLYEVITLGLRAAETDPQEVQYLEAHATSTVVGDADYVVLAVPHTAQTERNNFV